MANLIYNKKRQPGSKQFQNQNSDFAQKITKLTNVPLNNMASTYVPTFARMSYLMVDFWFFLNFDFVDVDFVDVDVVDVDGVDVDGVDVDFVDVDVVDVDFVDFFQFKFNSEIHLGRMGSLNNANISSLSCQLSGID